MLPTVEAYGLASGNSCMQQKRCVSFMSHVTLFLFKSTTFDGTQPAVSVHIHYLKGKRYSSKYTGHRFCLSIRQHSALVEGRIGVPEYLSGKIEEGYGTK